MAGEQGCEIRGDLAHNVMKSEQGCEYLGDLAHNVMKSEQGCGFPGDLAQNHSKKSGIHIRIPLQIKIIDLCFFVAF